MSLYLQRLDLILTEPNDATAPLQLDGTACKLAVLEIEGLFAIEDKRQAHYRATHPPQTGMT